jgi:hypothetical protein
VGAVYVGTRIADAAICTWRAAYDHGHVATTDGQVVKVHGRYIAVDDGSSDALVALPCAAVTLPNLGQRVAVDFTPKLHHVCAIRLDQTDRHDQSTPRTRETEDR